MSPASPLRSTAISAGATAWQDRDGNNRTSWEINADNVYFGESRRDSDSGRSDNYGSNYSNSYSSNSQSSYGGGYDAGRSGAPANANTFVELDDGDGELPF